MSGTANVSSNQDPKVKARIWIKHKTSVIFAFFFFFLKEKAVLSENSTVPSFDIQTYHTVGRDFLK